MTAGQPLAAQEDLRILIGYPLDAGFRIESGGDGIDLSDYRGLAWVKRTRASADVLLELTVDIVEPQTDDDKGRFRLQAEAEDTFDLPAVVGVWDVQFFDGDDIPQHWMQGDAALERVVTLEEAS